MPDKDKEEIKEETVTEEDIDKLFETKTHTDESDQKFLESLME